MLVLKISTNTWENASRDIRELLTYRELGEEIVVMAKGNNGDIGKKDKVAGFNVFRYSTKPLGSGRYLILFNRLFSIFSWAYYARQFKANVLSCHDLIALFIGYLSSIFIRKKDRPILVYDSHEFALGLNESRKKMVRLIVRYLEKYLMMRCNFSIMVNDTIADEVKRIHKNKNRSIVIRNIPEKFILDEKEIKNIRKMYLENLNISYDPFILMYHGGIMRNRGIENMLIAVSKIQGIVAIVLGNAQESLYLNELKMLCLKMNIEGRVLFIPAVPINKLCNYIGAADVGMVLLKKVNINHFYTLPNKYFENIQSLTPIICSNFPELKKITEKYKIGLTVNPDNIDEICEAIYRIRNNKMFYLKLKTNLLLAKNELCWENEKHKLMIAYKKYVQKKR